MHPSSLSNECLFVLQSNCIEIKPEIYSLCSSTNTHFTKLHQAILGSEAIFIPWLRGHERDVAAVFGGNQQHEDSQRPTGQHPAHRPQSRRSVVEEDREVVSPG